LCEGIEINPSQTPENEPEKWANITESTWSIGRTDFLTPYKQFPFTPTDLPVKYFTYQISFHVPFDTISYVRQNALVLGLYIEAIADNWEIYVNDNLIKSELYIDENGYITNHRNVASYAIPFDKNYIKEGKNTLTVHVAVYPNTLDAGIYYNNEIYIDDFSSIKKANADFFMLFFIGITAFMGFYNLLVFMGNVKDKSYLYFTMVQFLLSIYIFTNTSWISILILNSQISKTLEYGSMTLLPIFAALFTKGVAKERLGKFMYIVTAAQVFIATSLPFGGVQFAVDLLLASEVCMLISLVYGIITAVRWLIKAARLVHPDGRITAGGFAAVLLKTVMGNTLIGLVIVVSSALFAVIRSTFMDGDQNSIIIGLFAFVLSVSFSLQNEVTETKHQIVHQNEELEEMVQSRTRDLAMQTELAVTASKTKSRFLATMSHEIRTPMNAIIGISEILLQRSDLHKEVRTGLDKMHHSGQTLLGIINDILDLSKAETGKLEIIPTDFLFPSLINDAVQLNIGRIGSKPIEFTLSLSENLPEKLIGDELRIKQILNNILSNAFKYTEKGSVRFSISGENTERGFTVIFAISDTGQGMHEEEISALFDEYSRFNKIANRMTEGTGLGMNITGQLISLMEGHIDVKSIYGKGSTFTVTLPLGILPNSNTISSQVREKLCSFTFGTSDSIGERRKEMHKYMPYGTVLVVDDVETNLYVAEGLLRPYGVKISTAGSGLEAIDLIAKGNKYDVIFMDHMMPKMDGIEAVKIIRAKGYSLPIAALTANAIVGNDILFKESGFDDYISKPIDIRDLDRILVKFIHDRHPEQKTAKHPNPTEKSENMNPKLFEVFLKDVKKAVVSMPAQFASGDLKALTITAHGMKSAAANVGEREVSETAKTVELAAKDNDNNTVAKELPDLLNMLTRILDKPDTEQHNPVTVKANIPEEIQRELLISVAQCCREYDESGATTIIAEIREYELSVGIQMLLQTIEDYLLHAEFENAEAEIIGKLNSL
jgi:signal transduction histidine kinase/DNA-binding response OmpR family regulator